MDWIGGLPMDEKAGDGGATASLEEKEDGGERKEVGQEPNQEAGLSPEHQNVSESRTVATVGGGRRKSSSVAAYAGFAAEIKRKEEEEKRRKQKPGSSTGCKPSVPLTRRREDGDGDGGDKGSRDRREETSRSSNAGPSITTIRNDGSVSGGGAITGSSTLKIELFAKIADKGKVSVLDNKLLQVIITLVKSGEVLRGALLSKALAVEKSFEDNHLMIVQNTINKADYIESDKKGFAALSNGLTEKEIVIAMPSMGDMAIPKILTDDSLSLISNDMVRAELSLYEMSLAGAISANTDGLLSC
jgi:hypothetical protein